MSSGKLWVLYDGRAEHDVDRASVLEAMTSKRQVKRAINHWDGVDGVLFEYDVDADSNATNGQRIGHLREGQKRLLSQCSSLEAHDD